MGALSGAASGAAAGAAGGPVGIAIGAGIGAISGYFSSKREAEAAEHAAQTQATAANRAGDLQAQAAKDALDFQKSEAARAQHNFDVTQRATYEQWAAQQRRLSAVGVLAGLAPRDIPAYVDPTGQSSSGANSQGLDALQVSNAPVDYIKDLLNKGTSIPDALQQANTKFGRTHGNEFVYDQKTGT